MENPPDVIEESMERFIKDVRALMAGHQRIALNLLDYWPPEMAGAIQFLIDSNKDHDRGIGPPNDPTLPYFAYGAFKEGELAYRLIKGFVKEAPTTAQVTGSLLVRDGLPLLKPGRDGKVSGQIIFFNYGDCATAYELIGRFEPEGHYSWHTMEFPGKSIRANCLIGKKFGRGRPFDYDKEDWTFRTDPVFTDGMPVVAEMVRCHAQEEFKFPDWPRFFKLQMAYLLLWAGIERLASLSVGPGLEPMEKIIRFSQDPDFGRSLGELVKRTEAEIYDARDPKSVYRLDPHEPLRSIKYYYQIRNNLSHRAKGAWADGEIVRQSLCELSAVFERTLKYKGVLITNSV